MSAVRKRNLHGPPLRPTDMRKVWIYRVPEKIVNGMKESKGHLQREARQF